MGTIFGKDTRLSFGIAGQPETFPTLGGEKTVSYTRAGTDVDTTDKDGPSGLFVPGRVSFSVSGNVKLPDAALSAALAAAKTGTPTDVKLGNGALVRYAGAVTVGNVKIDFDAEGAVPYSFDMTQYGTATTDALDAVPA